MRNKIVIQHRKMLIKGSILCVLLIVGLIDVLIYWNQHIYYKAQSCSEYGEKIDLLNNAVAVYPLNDLVNYELGKTYFLQSKEKLSSPDIYKYLDLSIEEFKKSVAMNRFSPFTHFYLAQAALFKELLTGESSIDYNSELIKSAQLVAFNSQMYYEVAAMLLSRWGELNAQEIEFCARMVSDLWIEGDNNKILSLLQIWEMNVENYDFLNAVVPQTIEDYRICAEFLGERSLSLNERYRLLSKSELMTFNLARDAYKAGEYAYYRNRFSEGAKNFQSCLKRLDEIHFYQYLPAQTQNDTEEYADLLKNALLYLAKSQIEEGKVWGEYEKTLKEYLKLDVSMTESEDLERFLLDRKVLNESLTDQINNYGKRAFHFALLFLQNRFREVIRYGKKLDSHVSVIPEDSQEDYANILYYKASSLQKLESLYEARDIFLKALYCSPKHLPILLALRQNYERLNERAHIIEINNDINSILSPKYIDLKSLSLGKGLELNRELVLDGSKIELILNFKIEREKSLPLISILFNGRIIWEEYLDVDNLSLTLESSLGENDLQIRSVNQSVNLVGLQWKSQKKVQN